MKNLLFLLLVLTFIQWIGFFLVFNRNTNEIELYQLQLQALHQELGKKNKQIQVILGASNTTDESLEPVAEHDQICKKEILITQVQTELAKLGSELCEKYLHEAKLVTPKCLPPPSFPNKRYVHPYFQKVVDSMILEEDLDCFAETQYSGAIVYLGPRKDKKIGIHGQPTNRTNILLVSLKRLHKYFNAMFHYPIFVFHEDYNKEDMKQFRAEFGHPIHFVRVDFSTLPDCAIDNPLMDKWLAKYDKPIGYRQMCRLWSGIVQNAKILSPYEYYLRLDDDTMLFDWVHYDVFEYLSKYNKTYLYQNTFSDGMHSKNLWAKTSEWLKTHNKNVPTSGEWMTRGSYHGFAPYNNFHATRLDFWRSKELGDLFKYLDADTCGFMQHAWGDANFHAVALMGLLPNNTIACAESFPTQHNSNFRRMTDADPDAWALDPDS